MAIMRCLEVKLERRQLFQIYQSGMSDLQALLMRSYVIVCERVRGGCGRAR